MTGTHPTLVTRNVYRKIRCGCSIRLLNKIKRKEIPILLLASIASNNARVVKYVVLITMQKYESVEWGVLCRDRAQVKTQFVVQWADRRSARVTWPQWIISTCTAPMAITRKSRVNEDVWIWQGWRAHVIPRKVWDELSQGCKCTGRPNYSGRVARDARVLVCVCVSRTRMEGGSPRGSWAKPSFTASIMNEWISQR